MKWPYKIALVLFVLLVALLVWAVPPAGTYIVPSFFTTNAAKIYGIGGLTVSSQTVNGTYTLDASGIGGGSSNFIATANGVGTNTALRGLTITVGQTNSQLTASKIMLTGANKESVSSAFGESDLASFVSITILNFASNVLWTLNTTTSNGLSGQFIRNYAGIGTNTTLWSTNDDDIALTLRSGTNTIEVKQQFIVNGTNSGTLEGSQYAELYIDSAKSVADTGTLYLGYYKTNSVVMGRSDITGSPDWNFDHGQKDFYPGNTTGYTIGLNAAFDDYYTASGGLQAQMDTKQQKFSVASNNVVIVSSGSVTQFDFYAFTSLTQANGKLSIGAPDISASASNALVNIATNNVTVAPGAGTLVSTSYVGGKVIYTVSDTEVASTMVRTNFVLNQVYTNTSVQPILIKADTFMITAAVSGDCALDLMYSVSGGTGYTLLSRVAIATTIAGGLALPITNTICGIVTNLASFYFTNTSSGVGNSAGLVGNGTGQYVIIGGGAVGPTGATGAAGSMGISLQATNFGSTIGSGSNLVVIVESNLTMFATNTPTAGGTNSIKFNTAQPITTTSEPTFGAEYITRQLNAGGLVVTNGITNLTATASTVAAFDSNKKEVSVPNPTVGAGMPLIFNGTNAVFDTPDDGWFINDEINGTTIIAGGAGAIWTTLSSGTAGTSLVTSSTNWGEAKITNGPSAGDRMGIVNPNLTATYVITNTELWCYVRANNGTLNSASISNSVIFGLADTFVGTPSNGIWIQYSQPVNRWQAVVSNAGAVTTNALTIAATKDEWREFIWHLDQTQTSVYYYSGNRAQNSTIWCTNTVALPTAACNFFFASRRMSTQTSGSATNLLDHFKVWKRNLL